MLLFCRRNNIARGGIQLQTINVFTTGVNNLANLYNYSVGDGMVFFDESMSLGKFGLYSKGLENNFVCTTVDVLFKTKSKQPFISERIWMGDESLMQYGIFQLCGESVPLYKGTKKGKHIIDGVELWRFDFCGDTYKVYPVNLGKKGSFLCFYRNKVLVAISEIERRVVNHETHYTIYAEDDVVKELLYMMTVQWDFEHYMDMDEVTAGAINKARNHDVRIINESYWAKEAREKFDPEFIERIKRQSGNEGGSIWE